MTYDQKTINEIKEMIKAQQASIAVAESVTSGQLQGALSLAEGASEYFQGGITCYNLGQKTRHLNIEPILAEKSSCIHRKIAADMALAVSKLFISDYGIGITGYATIVPEIEGEGLFAFVAISYQAEVVLQERITSTKTDQLSVQVDYTQQVLQLLHQHLTRSK